MMEQEVVIRRLEPKLCGDWLYFFDNIAFQDHQDWAFCYCLEGHLDPKTQEEWTDVKERREKAVELIQAGEMQGYLAYRADKVIGWCNVNERKNYRYLTEMFRKIGYQADEAEDIRAQEGYAYVEAYPFADDQLEFQYHGTSGMYERNGFKEAADLQYVKVMRKELGTQNQTHV